jgi:hypothetical protein
MIRSEQVVESRRARSSCHGPSGGSRGANHLKDTSALVGIGRGRSRVPREYQGFPTTDPESHVATLLRK